MIDVLIFAFAFIFNPDFGAKLCVVQSTLDILAVAVFVWCKTN
jgi:hypothetical protein